jgi:drug/metabolite transporter (DMT)-like permease
MKLNFWQWLGIILVVVAGIFIIRREMSGPARPSGPAEPAPLATQPQ